LLLVPASAHEKAPSAANTASMLKTKIRPPLDRPNQNPVLYGVANGLAKLFPPVQQPAATAREAAPPRDAGQPSRG
jgi:hypothetical protein